MGEKRKAYRVFVGKLGENEPLGRFRHRWEDNIKMYLYVGVGWGCELDSSG
jgi:hypothetical protein